MYSISKVSTRLNSTLKKTALYDLHVSLGATMVPFAGYSMPVIYKGQTQVESHNWTRTKCGIFDVSHMLQSTIKGKDSINFLNKITPTDFSSLKNNHNSLTVLLNKDGGIVDDSIITKENDNDNFYVVTNAGCIEQDTKFLRAELSENFKDKDVKWELLENKSLFAMQGPNSHTVLSRYVDNEILNNLYFGQRIKNVKCNNIDGLTLDIARSGYTGEDGFEISIDTDKYESFVKELLTNEECRMIGLAARDSLRLEAGMCLYGHELNETITPVEASLTWLVSKSRRTGELANFNGKDKILNQIATKSHTKLRTGFKFIKKGPPAREHTPIFSDEAGTQQVGEVTSGSPSPSLNNINIGQAYLNKPYNKAGTKLFVGVGKKNKMFPIEVSKLPFIAASYYKN